MNRSPTPDIADALAAMRMASGRGRGRKSEVYRWMAQHYDELAGAFAQEGGSWTALAGFLSNQGMRTADGLPLSAASVRSVWVRLSQTRGRQPVEVAGESPGETATPLIVQVKPPRRAKAATDEIQTEQVAEPEEQGASAQKTAKPNRKVEDMKRRGFLPARAYGLDKATVEALVAAGKGDTSKVQSGGGRKWLHETYVSQWQAAHPVMG
jgi:hypothetical protein